VLENTACARLSFLLGGVSGLLLDKRDGRLLIRYRSGTGRLALRNAWFSGGIEWTIGFRGHTPFTAASLFAARLTDGGRPVLRFYEWERVTGVPFQMDCFFTGDDSDFLFTAVKIVNPDAVAASTYWWSNTAFPETADTRVIVPAERAIIHSKDGIELVHPAGHNGVDATYPERERRHRLLFICPKAPSWPQGERTRTALHFNECARTQIVSLGRQRADGIGQIFEPGVRILKFRADRPAGIRADAA
jgi:hypothetical protein